MIKYIINYVMENATEEMEFFNNFVDKGLIERLTSVVNSEFKRLPYTEAIELLQKSGHKFEFPVEWGCDLQTEHERYLTEEIIKGMLEEKKIKNKSKEKDIFIKDIEERLMNTLGTKVNISTGNKKGKIEIEYYTDDDLNDIIDRLLEE